MRFYKPEVGSYRTVRRFLFWPKTLKATDKPPYQHHDRFVTRWLEVAHIRQTYARHHRGWIDHRWDDI